MSAPRDITKMLAEWSNGHEDVLNRLVPLIYDELRRLAARSLRRHAPQHTLQPTALVHEAYLRMVARQDLHCKNRAHFLGLAARCMRDILIDHARRRGADKRGGSLRKVSVDEVVDFFQARDLDLVALDDALTGLAAVDPQKSRVVELRFFGGLTVDEAAEVLGLSPRTVDREWTTAKAWLRRELRKGDRS